MSGSSRSKGTPPMRMPWTVSRPPAVVFEDVEDVLAGLEAVEEDGHRPDVVGHETDPGQVGGQALELGQDDPDVLGPLGDLDPGQLLDGQDIGQVVGHGGEVIQPVGQGDDLGIGQALPELLHPPVEIAEDGLDAEDDLVVDR